MVLGSARRPSMLWRNYEGPLLKLSEVVGPCGEDLSRADIQTPDIYPF